MRLQKQAHLHRPEDGVWGDCYRTAIACVLGVDKDEVPHFLEGGPSGDEALARARAWLGERGTYLVEIPVKPIEQGVGHEGVLEMMGAHNPEAEWILGGESANGFGHVVVCRGGEIVHDPAIDESGIVGPSGDGFYWITLLARAST